MSFTYNSKNDIIITETKSNITTQDRGREKWKKLY